jgi:hypothetical protein
MVPRRFLILAILCAQIASASCFTAFFRFIRSIRLAAAVGKRNKLADYKKDPSKAVRDVQAGERNVDASFVLGGVRRRVSIRQETIVDVETKTKKLVPVANFSVRNADEAKLLTLEIGKGQILKRVTENPTRQVSNDLVIEFIANTAAGPILQVSSRSGISITQLSGALTTARDKLKLDFAIPPDKTDEPIPVQRVLPFSQPAFVQPAFVH